MYILGKLIFDDYVSPTSRKKRSVKTIELSAKRIAIIDGGELQVSNTNNMYVMLKRALYLYHEYRKYHIELLDDMITAIYGNGLLGDAGSMQDSEKTGQYLSLLTGGA